MNSGCFSFGGFTLDPDNRRLSYDDKPVELSSRYLDALVLMVREAGRLVSKDRFMDEVWRGIPVTDEALTQCIRTLRRQLGDDAANPRFIETVPKHGYRFVASVDPGEPRQEVAPKRTSQPGHGARRRFLIIGLAGTAGGAIAGLLGGFFYGFAASAGPLGPGTGGSSVLLVLLAITIIVATVGAAGVSFGIAAAGGLSRDLGRWSVAGGAAGGLAVGAFVELIGLDAFRLLFGRGPADMTGAIEGLILGGAVGSGMWLAASGAEQLSLRSKILLAALVGACAGIAIAVFGGHLLGGSLDLLAQSFPDSRLGLERLGALVGEQGFGRLAHVLTAAIEGALFAGCIVGAMLVADRNDRPGAITRR
jgi:DNA-binding winged helix-turn-helix (wHTH) protein